MRDGEVYFREIDGEAVHSAVNVGDGPWRNIVVELKDAGVAEPEDPDVEESQEP